MRSVGVADAGSVGKLSKRALVEWLESRRLMSHNLEIGSGVVTSGVTINGGSFIATGDNATLNAADVSNALAMGDVSISIVASGPIGGVISMDKNSGIGYSGTASRTLSIQSGGGSTGGIHLLSPISSLNPININLSSPSTVDVSGGINAPGSTLTISADTGGFVANTLGQHVDVGSGSVIVQPLTSGRAIDITSVIAPGRVQEDPAQLKSITSAGTITIGNSAAGNVTVSSSWQLSSLAKLNILSAKDINIGAGATISGATDMALRACGNVSIDPTASLIGTGKITLVTDFGDTDISVGGTINVSGGSLQASSAELLGADDADTFNLSPSAVTPIDVEGGNPATAPGDALNVTLGGAADPYLTITSGGVSKSGRFDFSNRQSLSFGGIESISPETDISVSITDGQTSATPGTPDSYTIVVTNTGSIGEAGIHVADPVSSLLSGVQWAAAFTSGSSGTSAGTGDVDQTITLAGGGSATYTVSGLIPSGATLLSNTVSISAGDADSTNDSATDVDLLVPPADLGISVTSPASATEGNPITFAIGLVNNGPSDAQQVLLHDLVPTGADLVSLKQQSGSSFTIDSVAGTAQISSLPAGAAAEFVLVVTGKEPGTLSGTAVLESNTSDLILANNLAALGCDVLDAPLDVSAVTIAATEGSQWTGSVAQFVDENPMGTSADFSATVDWGDGKTSAGTIEPDGSGGFLVVSSHLYPQAAADVPVAVSIKDVDGATATDHSTVTVADAPLTPAGHSNINALEGIQFSGYMAVFSDANPFARSNDFSATIHWGDGSVSPATIKQGSTGRFQIWGTHTYSKIGGFALSINVNDQGGASTVITGLAAVNDARLVAGASRTLSTKLQNAFSGVIASFVDTDPLNTAPANYTIVINWGDGTTSKGTAVLTSAGHWNVLGTHKYARKGSFKVSTSVKDRLAPIIVNATMSVV